MGLTTLLEVDVTAPSISGVDIVEPSVDGYVVPADLGVGASVTVNLNLSEAPASGYPKVRLGNQELESTCNAGAGSDYSCTASYSLGAAEADGIRSLSIR